MSKLSITRLEDVGNHTIAIEVETPNDFEAYPGQFVLVKGDIDGEEETGYYTISSPTVEETFEMTIAVDPDGTLGPWLSERTLNEEITVEGPFGNVRYTGDSDAFVFAGGPGIGPAIGIAESAMNAGHDVTIVYGGNNPPHERRLNAIERDGATLVFSNDLKAAVDSLELSTAETYVFGFQSFVEDVKTALTEADVDLEDIEIESFGPE